MSYWTDQELTDVAGSLNIAIDDMELLQGYLDCYAWIGRDKDGAIRDGLDMITEYLPKWIEQASEFVYMDGVTDGADFAERFANEYMTELGEIPSWMVIDWDASWNHNLRHEFSISQNGYVFADH